MFAWEDHGNKEPVMKRNSMSLIFLARQKYLMFFDLIYAVDASHV